MDDIFNNFSIWKCPYFDYKGNVIQKCFALNEPDSVLNQMNFGN
jgi:hypothetical protein